MPLTPRKVSLIFDFFLENVALLVFVAWILPPVTSLSSRLFVYFCSLGVLACLLGLKWLMYVDKPQPTLQGRALRPKLVLGNAVGAGFMVAFYLQGMSPRGLILAGLLIFLGGNFCLLLERRWERGYLRR